MEEVRKEELEEQRVELLPDREEMNVRAFNRNAALSAAINGSASTANAGNVFIFAVED
jgi:hypothetical protein